MALLSTVSHRLRRLVSRRLQAGVLTAALMLGAAAPPSVAVAREADQSREGVATPDQAAPDSTADPDFDPGSATELPFDVGGSDIVDDSGDGAPVDSEPVHDPDAPPAPTDDTSTLAPAEPAPGDDATAPDEAATAPADTIPPAEAVTPPVEPTPTPAAPPPATTAPPPPAAATPTPERHQRNAARRHKRDRAHHPRATPVPAAAPSPAPAPSATPVETTTQPEPATVETTPPAPSDRIRPGQRSHTVRPGESLWMIASDVLGEGATNAQLAAETNRLYRLNRDRIGDDPNLLLAGTVLRLR